MAVRGIGAASRRAASRVGGRRVWVAAAVWMVCALAGLAGGSASVALGAESSSSSSSSSSATGGLGALVVPGVQSLTGDQQVQAAEEAKRRNPEAVALRAASRTKFEHLGAGQAAQVAGEAFPGVVDEAAGGPPRLPAGQRITGYLTDNAASVDVGGRPAVVESSEPIAVQTSSGRRQPIDLALNDTGSSFQPAISIASASIPKRLGAGVSLPGVGVSVTPVDAQGVALGGSEGAANGVSVLYANTQADSDTLVKPTTSGFEADTVLRSVDSPQQLFFRVGLPAGAKLVQARDGSGSVEVVKEGAVIATVLPAGAQDAAGASVPVSMSVSGDTLVLSVADQTAEYQYPIEVDPTFLEEKFTESGSKRSNWQWETSNTSRFASKPTENKETKELGEASPGALETYGTAAYAESEKAYWAYQTQGDSKIYEVYAETEAKNKEDRIESFLELEAHGTGAEESKVKLSTEAEGTSEYARKPATICPWNSKKELECTSTAGGEGNAVRFQQSVVNNPTGKYSFSDFLYKGEVYLSEPAGTHSTVKYNTSTQEFSQKEIETATKGQIKEPRKNILYSASSWLSEYDGAFEPIAEDPGIGVSATRLEYESSPGKWEQVVEHNYLTEGNCTGVQCNPKHTELWTLNKRLPNGEDKIRYRAEDAMGAAKRETESLESEGGTTVKVDYAKPHGTFITGLPYGNELSEKTYELTAYTTDGEGSTIASSGIASTELFVDNKSIKDVSEEEKGKNTEGTCSVPNGECTAQAKYKIKGAELGAGHHAIVVVAKDKAGNEQQKPETISIRHSTPVALGPGSVDLESGDFTLGPSDVSLGSGLSVSRVYSSRDLTAGVEGGSLLGGQWSLSVGSEETLVELVDHSVLVTSGSGGQTVFAAVLNSEGNPTGKFEAPPGDSNLTMIFEENKVTKEKAYYLTDPAEGTSTKFALSSTPTVWVPTQQEGPVASDTVSYLYETVEVGGKKVTRPSEERAATPAKVSCAPKMEPGCRALKFTYATKTKSEIGEGPTEWGEYEGRLVKISYEGYNPATKKMTEPAIPVAEYVYDKQGRLRAEWDPRLSPALKTTYGYDEEGHVTAVSPPGQQPWLLHYGTSTTEASTSRILSVIRPPASTAFGNGQTPVNTVLPKLSTSAPTHGTQLSVSRGTWSNSPLEYGFQWERCNVKGEACAPILGATNEHYTPTYTDEENTLRARVSAINAAGTVAMTTAVSAEVPYSVAPYELKKTFTAEGTHALKAPVDVSGYGTLVTDSGNNRVVEFNKGEYRGEFGKEGTELGKMKGPTGISYLGGNTYIANTGNNRVENYSGGFYQSGEVFGSCGSEKLSKPEGVANVLDEFGDYNTYILDTGNSKVDESNYDGLKNCVVGFGKSGTGNGQFKTPKGIAVAKPNGTYYLWVSDTGNNRLQEFEVHPWTGEHEFKLVLGSAGTGNGEFKEQQGISYREALEKGKGRSFLAVADTGNSRVQLFYEKPSGKGVMSYLAKFGKAGSGSEQFKEPRGVEVGETGEIFVADTGNNRVQEWVQGPRTDPAPSSGGNQAVGSNSVWTVGYNTPLQGVSSLPQMGVNSETKKPEPEKWGQVDDPVEATSIFPPDSPQGWPASSYTRATTYYLDEQGRLVNTAAPSTGKYGAVSTTEYNETNDVVRTLSPDNRATSLGEGCESEANCASAKKAKLLSTENTYNGEGEKESEVSEPGTRMILSRGPEHTVKYVAGEEHYEAGEKPKEGLARSLTEYFYNEGAPTENPRTKKKETYDLATTTQSYAQLINGEGKETERVDLSETKTGYAGQEDLGWQLRTPTSTTAAPGAQNLTSTTEYYESGEAMGKVKETRTPKGAGGKSAHDKKIVYYGMEENKEYPECGKHPEWAGLVCETLPAKQPETTGVPNLPVTKTTYNVWNEPETIVETFPKSGSFAEHTRTTKDEYDAAGRMKTSEKTSTATTGTTDKTLPMVTEEYNSATGALEKQSTTVSGKTKTITNVYNTLGQLESSTDADGNVAKFKYTGPESDGALEEMSDGSDEGSSTQKYTYSTTTKQLEKLVDSAAGTFTASYDTEGKLASVVYPNETCANYTNNSVGEATHISYTKTSSCSEAEGVWFSETKTPSIRGEVISKTSTLASEEYGYDTLGRLTEVHETPAGEYCKTRLYEYDEESNRKKLTARAPNSKNECATTGGTEEKHEYDEANRLIDSGIEYDPLGNVTKLPAGDAEGHALESSFYVDNAVATQTQNGVSHNYYMDPDGRVRETISGAQKIITHYDSSGEAVGWTCEGSEKAETCESGGKWTRNIPGIDGTLAAVENGKGATYETPILQLHDLQGNVVATIKDKTGETKLESTYNSTEYGVPNAGKEPPKFAWLGAGGVEKSLASGVVTEGATSYVPQTGRALQSEEVAPPGLPDGSGAGAPYIFQEEAWVLAGATREANEAPGLEAQREKEAYEAALNAAGAGEDPTRWLYLEEAEHTASKLEKLSSFQDWFDVFSEFFDIAQLHLTQAVEGAIIDHFDGWDTIKNYDNHVAHLLNECASVIYGSGHYAWEHAKCKLDFTDWFNIWTPFGNIEMINFFDPASVSVCTGADNGVGTCAHLTH